MDVKVADLDDGLRLEYVEVGDRDGVPVLLLHGATDSWRAWEPVLAHLPSGVRALAISQRGHGGSSKPDAGYTPTHFADDAASFLDAVGLDRAVCVGHSSHGLAAQALALEHRARVLGIVAVSAPDSFRGSAALGQLIDELADAAGPLDADFVRDFQSGTTAMEIDGAFLELVVAESMQVPPRVWRAVFEGLRDEDVSPRRAGIDVPTLLLWGDADTIVGRADQERVAAAIAGAELVVYEGVGHAPHWEAPARLAVDLGRFAAVVGR